MESIFNLDEKVDWWYNEIYILFEGIKWKIIESIFNLDEKIDLLQQT